MNPTHRGMVVVAVSIAAHLAFIAIPTGANRAPISIDTALEVKLETPQSLPAAARHQELHWTPPHAQRSTPTEILATNTPIEPLAIETPAPSAALPEVNTIDASANDDVSGQPSPESLLQAAGAASSALPTDAGNATLDFSLVLSYLRDVIERNKTYPPLARQRGWEGEVLLGFHVVADGAIERVHVARSSGNRLLDQSAVKALQTVDRVTPDLWRSGNDADLRLSVVYRLM